MIIDGTNVIGKISLKKLYEEWKKEGFTDDYYEPMGKWRYKKSAVFEDGSTVCLFETNEDGKNYYRAISVVFEGEKFRYNRKIRFCRNEKRIIDFAITGKSIVFVEKCGNDRGIYVCTDGDEDDKVPKFTDLISRARDITSAVIGSDLYFLYDPEIYINSISKVVYDALDAYAKKNGNAKDDDDDDDGCSGDDDNYDIEKASYSVAEKVQRLGLKTPDEPDAAEKLSSLIGLSEVKKKILELKAYVRMRKRMEVYGKKPDDMCLNMVFTGNPGTAKTTVARLFAEILYAEGVVKTNKFLEVGRSDLVAVYTGQTAVKTKKVFKDIKGGVLFVDEAYSICECDSDSYGKEALATMIQEMENNRDTVLILAGYKNETEQLFSRNPGLRSRVPVHIDFDDYTPDELTEITKTEAERRGYKLGSGAKRKIKMICCTAAKEKDFGNGRFCRMLVESAELKHALSISDRIDKAGKKELFTLGPDDFSMPEIMTTEERNNGRIGFCA